MKKSVSAITLLIAIGLLLTFFIRAVVPSKAKEHYLFKTSLRTSVFPDSIISPLNTKLPSLMVKGEKQSNPVKLSELKISTIIVGNIAVTTMDMLFYNDSSIVLSGELYFPLNEGQTVTQFALEVNGKLRDGVVVEKAKGRIAFETMVRRGVDPGLVELTKGNNFKTRIYPIPSKGYKRVVVSYNQELINSETDTYYQLPLFFNEKVDLFTLDIEVYGKEIPNIDKGKLSNFAFKSWNENYKAFFKDKDYFAQEELVIRVPKTVNSPKTISGKREKGGSYVYSNISIVANSSLRKESNSICVVWDVSRSGRLRNTNKEIEFLKEFLDRKTSTTLRLITFANDIFINKSIANKEELINIIETLKYDGGTQLGVLNFDEIKEDEIILFSEAIHTFGSEDLILSLKPIHFVNTASGADYVLQNHISQSTSGGKVDLTRVTFNQALDQLKKESFQFISYEVLEGDLDAVYPKERQSVGNSFSFSGILLSEKAIIKLNFGVNNEITSSKTIEINLQNTLKHDEIATRMWAEKKIADLIIQYKKNKDEITKIGKEFSIVTRNTSLIVLDNVEDYVEHEIVPPSELMKDYTRLIESKNKIKTDSDYQKIETVKANWQKRVEWWNKEIIEVKTRDTLEQDSLALLENYMNDTSVTVTGDVMYNMQSSTQSFSSNRELSNVGVVATDGVTENNADLSTFSDEQSNSTSQPNLPKKVVKGKIKLKEWSSDNKESKILTKETTANCYNKYLELLSKNDGQPIFYSDAADVLYKKGRKKEAMRVISNLAELDFDNHELLKVLANKLMEWKEYELAIYTYREILNEKEEEPQSYRDLGLALKKNGEDQKAIEMLYQVVEKNWDNRFPEIENIVLGEINGIISNSKKQLNIDFIDKELLDQLPMSIRILIDWDADNVDIDLWVTDPNGEKCLYSHPNTAIGGLLSRDFTRGYGPEEFLLKKAIKGTYKIEVNYFGTTQQRTAGPPTIRTRLITNYGLKGEKEKNIILRLKAAKDVVFIGELEIE